MKLGKIEKVKNIEQKLNENEYYNRVAVIYNGTRKVLLFSDYDIKKAMTRASKNKEDLGKFGWLRRLFCL